MDKVVRCIFDGALGKVKGEIILSSSRLNRLVNKLINLEEFAFDTEFTDLQVQYPGKSTLVGISFCFGENENYYIPLGHKDWSQLRDEEESGLESRQLKIDLVIKKLKPVFERKVLVIGHNIKIDLHPLANHGINFDICEIFDTMEGTFIIDENVPKGLKELTLYKYNVPQVEFSEVVSTVTSEEKKLVGLKGSNKASIDLVRVSNASSYAMADSYWTWRHYVDWILDGIDSESMGAIYYKVRMPFLRTLYSMERRGLRIDVSRLKEMQERAEKDLEQIMYDVYELTGLEFNLGSSQQLSELLFGYAKVNKKGEFAGNKELIDASYNFPIQGTTKKGGAPSTGESELLALLKINYKDKRKQEGQKVLRLILKYKKLAKLKNAFMDGLLDLQFADGKVHPSINSCGADSGRLSCSSPNLQQLPRPVEVPPPPTPDMFEDAISYKKALNEYKTNNKDILMWKSYEIRDCFIPDDPDSESIIAVDLVA